MSGVQHVVLVRSNHFDGIVSVVGPFNSVDEARAAVANLDTNRFNSERKTLHCVLDAAYWDES